MTDTDEIARRMRAENKREEAALLSRRVHAQETARHLAERILALHPEVARVWGFGSTFELWRNYRMTSDIDLAIEAGDVMEILSLAKDSGYSVDLINLSDCPSSMAEFIRSQGVVVAGGAA